MYRMKCGCAEMHEGDKKPEYFQHFSFVSHYIFFFFFLCCIVPLRNKQRQIVFITFVFVSAEVQTLNQLQQCFVLGFVF